MRKMNLGLFLFTISISFSSSIFSANLAFMQDTPAQYYTQQDWQMFVANKDAALNTLANGQTKTWKNPATGNGGSFMPINSIRKQGAICRDLQITSQAQSRIDRSVFRFCKYRTGWAVSN